MAYVKYRGTGSVSIGLGKGKGHIVFAAKTGEEDETGTVSEADIKDQVILDKIKSMNFQDKEKKRPFIILDAKPVPKPPVDVPVIESNAIKSIDLKEKK